MSRDSLDKLTRAGELHPSKVTLAQHDLQARSIGAREARARPLCDRFEMS